MEVTATKTWRRGDPKSVRIESKKASDGSILVCALWTEETVCTEDRYSTNNDRGRRNRDDDNHNDVAVDFEVRVPKGVKVGIWTVNGAASVDGVTSEVHASTVNGRFQPDWPVTISGRIDPRHLRATLGKGGRRIRLSTVNGNVELRKR